MKVGVLLLSCILCSCSWKERSTAGIADSVQVIKPFIVTDPVTYDTDDPAIWINPSDPAGSLIIGTDKGGDLGDGALFVFGLDGKEIREKRVMGLSRPNNVDVAYGLLLNGARADVAACTERNTNSIRVFRLPDMSPVDGGGIPVFENDSLRSPMGIALYTDPSDGRIYAIVGRKSGLTDGTYLWQYLLGDNGSGTATGTLKRKFGMYSGMNEIESIAVDNELGYIYYSDENYGVRKYYAHPDSSAVELATFATSGFAGDHEGISIYKFADGTGYILVSDQGANKFHVFPREGTGGNPHDHTRIGVFNSSTLDSDGSDVTSAALPGFPHGLFVAMSDDRTFQIYRWEDIAGDSLHINWASAGSATGL